MDTKAELGIPLSLMHTCGWLLWPATTCKNPLPLFVRNGMENFVTDKPNHRTSEYCILRDFLMPDRAMNGRGTKQRRLGLATSPLVERREI